MRSPRPRSATASWRGGCGRRVPRRAAPPPMSTSSAGLQSSGRGARAHRWVHSSGVLLPAVAAHAFLTLLKCQAVSSCGGLNAVTTSRHELQELCSDFFSALGPAGDAEELWREMAELLPSPQLYGELMEALRSMQGGRSASNVALDQQQPSVRRQASSMTSAPGPSTPGGKQTGQPQQASRWSATASSARGSNSGAGSHGETQQQRPARSGSTQCVEVPDASMATLLAAAGVHPNSQAVRPAKPLPAAKRARGSGSATAARAVPADGTAAGGCAPT